MEHVRGPLSVRYLEQEWRAHPRCNVSMLPGRRSGWLCGDVDPRHGGSLEALWARGWPRVTPTERTGSGGWHVYVRCPAAGLPTVHTYAPGIEVLADGGQVIMAPSLHPSGQRYRWLDGLSPWDVPIAELAPEVLAGIQRKAPKRERTTEAVFTPEELARMRGLAPRRR